MGTYITASEYAPLASSSDTYDPEAWLDRLLRQFPRDDMLIALAALNRIATDRSDLDALLTRLLGQLTPPLAEWFETELRHPREGRPRRHLVTRPVILRAMRLVAEFHSKAQPMENVPTLGLEPLETAVFLTHAVADGLGADAHPEEADGRTIPRLGGLPEPLAIELLCAGFFSRIDVPANLLGRTRLLYTHYGNKISRTLARRSPIDLVNEALGLSMDTALAIGFGYYAQALGQDGVTQGPRCSPPLDVLDVSEHEWRRFLEVFAQTPDELATSSAAGHQSWNMVAIQSKPLLRLGDDVVVLDQQYLLDRITKGLYWIVFDHEKELGAAEGDRRDRYALAWTQAHGEMHELLVESYLKQFAPPLLGGSSSMFFEEDFGAGYSGKRIDVGIDFGNSVVMAEAQGGQVTIGTRAMADVAAFKKDIDRLLLHKTEQLDESANLILRSPHSNDSPVPDTPQRIWPIVVTGGNLAASPILQEYVDAQIAERGLLADARIEPLVVLDLRDLEHADSTRQRDTVTLPQLLDEWRSSKYSSVSLSDWLITRDATRGKPSERSSPLVQAVEDSFTAILKHVREPSDDQGQDSPGPPAGSA